MISSKNLLLNSTPPLNPSNSSSEDSSRDPLNVSGLDENENKDDLNTEAVDPNAFVLLLNQTFTNIPPQDTAKSDSKDGEPLLQEMLNNESSQQTKASDILTDSSTALLTEAQTETNVDLSTDVAQANNPALHWIDSESYQSFALAATEANTNAALQNKMATDVKANVSPATSVTTPFNLNPTDFTVNTNTDVPEQVLSPSTTAVPSDATASVASEKIKDNVLQSLHQLSTTIMGGNHEALNADATYDALAQTAMNTVNSMHGQGVAQNQNISAQFTHTPIQPKALDIPLPLNHAQWGDKFSEHIVWLGKNDIQSALIKINPEELGPLEISVKVSKDSTSVTILSHSIQARDIVDQALPRLREMMAEQGLNLTDVQVSADQRSSQFSQNSSNQDSQNEYSFGREAEEEVQMITSAKKPPKGLVDYFA